jgi:HMG-box domain
MCSTDQSIMHYLARKISNEVDKTIQSFFEHLADTNPDQYQVEELMTQWKAFSQTKPKKNTRSKKNDDGDASSPDSNKKKKKKPSNYILFCKKTRPMLKDKGLTFGEISKELGRLWKLMSMDERAKYAEEEEESPILLSSSEETEAVTGTPPSTTITKTSGLEETSPVVETVKETSPVVETTPVVEKEDDEKISPIDFDKMLLPELKRMCKDRGLDIKKKKRAEIIDMLKNTAAPTVSDDEEEDYSTLLEDEEETMT